MDSDKVDVVHDFPPFIRVYKDGRVERFSGTDTVPSSVDPHTGVASKDITIVPETGVSARIFIPKIAHPHPKLPLLVYFHGGGFCIESPFSPVYHAYINSLVAVANVVAVSVDYRLAPEHLLPIAYDDSWNALEWVASHAEGKGSHQWLKDHADFDRVFLAGDSAGANIAHNMAYRVGSSGLCGGVVKVLGIALIHPYFGKEKQAANSEDDPWAPVVADEFWHFLCPSTTGSDDPLMNPASDPRWLSGLGCKRVMMFVAEKDMLRERGRVYYEKLEKSGWGGVVEIVEEEGEGHVFHLFNPTSDKAASMMKRLASFLNGAPFPLL